MTATDEKLTPQELADHLKREPLVGVTVASKLLGISASNFNRDASRHLTAIKIHGTGTLYFSSEVRKLKRTRDRARQRSAAVSS